MVEQLNSELCIRLDDPTGTDAGVEIHLVTFQHEGAETFGLYAQHEDNPDGVLIAHFLPEVPFEVALATLMTLNGGSITGMTLRAAQCAMIPTDVAPDGAEQEG